MISVYFLTMYFITLIEFDYFNILLIIDAC